MGLTLSSYKGRLQYLAEVAGAQSYLEIGVRKGDTFFPMDVPLKVAVDPNFLFDPEECKKPGEHYFSLTSDDFFAGLADDSSAVRTALAPHCTEGKITFDLIFIDGLHTFEQVLKDFENSLIFAHEKTLWLLDDTIPCDECSAISDMSVSLAERKKALLPGDSWHGDVFKIVPAIHDAHPDYSYCTLMEENPQTVVWKAEKREVAPAFPSLAAIAQMSCRDMLEHAALYFPTVAEELPKLLGQKNCMKANAQEEALRELTKFFRTDSKWKYAARVLSESSSFDFVKRWRRSIRKRLPKRTRDQRTELFAGGSTCAARGVLAH